MASPPEPDTIRPVVGETTGGTRPEILAESPRPDRGLSRREHAWRIGSTLGVPIILLVMMLFFSIVAPGFLTVGNFKNILATAALPSMLAVGLTFCLVMGDFDLSIGAASSFATMLFAVLAAKAGINGIVSIIVVLAAGLLIGVFNGVMVAYVGLSALVVTIAVASVLNGMEFAVSKDTQIYGGFPSGLVSLSRGSALGLPNVVWAAAAVAILAWVVLERTPLGRNLRAVGGNATAARVAGVPVERIRLTGFMMCTMLAVIAGIIYSAQQAVADPLNGMVTALLPSFAAAFIGAAAFKIGQFNIWGTVVGILITEVAINGLILLNVATWASYLSQGGILLVAVLFARIVARRGAVNA